MTNVAPVVFNTLGSFKVIRQIMQTEIFTLIQSVLGFCKFIITHLTCSYFTPKVVHLWKQHSPTHYVNNLNELPGIYDVQFSPKLLLLHQYENILSS